jgi:hypothetical protein
MRKTERLLVATFALVSCTSADSSRISGSEALEDVRTPPGPDGPAGPGAFVTTGGADVTFASGVFEERYSYVARTQPDGTVQGQFELQAHVFGEPINLHGTVLCYDIDPAARIARVVGEVDRTSNPSVVPEGTVLQWSAQDNGEGPNSEPDRQSDVFFGACPAQPISDVFLTPITTGNVQVHPAQGSR